MIGTSFAWLMDSPEPITNTFTYGDINIELTETDSKLDNDNLVTTNTYKMLPGQEIHKDPMVTVKSTSEEMWLFVKLEKSEQFDTFLTYSTEDGWIALEGVKDVYYQHIHKEDVALQDKVIPVIKNNTVYVKDSVTKEQLNSLDSTSQTNYPKLTITAYAIQHAGFTTAADAWATLMEKTNK